MGIGHWKVTRTTPGRRLISMEPAMVARLRISSGDRPVTLAARSTPLWVASLRVRPVPMKVIGPFSSTVAWPKRAARACTAARCSRFMGRAMGGRSSGRWSRIGPSRVRPLMTSTFTSVMPDTSVAWPATSPLPCWACMSPM